MSWHGLRDLTLLALAGALGALARYGLSAGLSTAGVFPWGIFIVNILGCGLFGLVWEKVLFNNNLFFQIVTHLHSIALR